MPNRIRESRVRHLYTAQTAESVGLVRRAGRYFVTLRRKTDLKLANTARRTLEGKGGAGAVESERRRGMVLRWGGGVWGRGGVKEQEAGRMR